MIHEDQQSRSNPDDSAFCKRNCRTPPSPPESRLTDKSVGALSLLCGRRCTVCLEEYEAKDVVRVLPACGHAFHAACIDAWLRQHPTCPVCRASLRARNGCRATPVDYSLLVTGADAAATVQHVPASSSGASPQAVGRQRQTDDTGRADGLLEIISEEPASSRDPSPAVAAAAGGNHSLCADDAERQSGEGSAGASEHW